MGKFICKDCGHEGTSAYVGITYKIFGFIFIFLFILLIFAFITAGDNPSTGATMAIGLYGMMCIASYFLYRIFRKRGCAKCKGRNIIPSDSPLGKKFKEQL